MLFAYFGFSLQVRKRKLQTDIRAKLAIKKRATKALPSHQAILIRDADDTRYPWLDPDEKLKRVARGRWCVRDVERIQHDGVLVQADRKFAYIADDGVHWDVVDDMNSTVGMHFDDPWDYTGYSEKPEHEEVGRVWHGLSEKNKAWLSIAGVIPFDNILAIDEDGDDQFKHPHIYTGPWQQNHHPFLPEFYFKLETVGANRTRADYDPKNRVSFFPPVRKPK